jgi:hypothetical protein
MACLAGFDCSIAAFVGVGVSAFQSMGICPLNGKRGPEYVFSIPDPFEAGILWKEQLQIWLRIKYPLIQEPNLKISQQKYVWKQ